MANDKHSTTVTALQARYDAVEDAYNRLDGAISPANDPATKVRNSHLSDGMSQTFQEMSLIQGLLVRQEPATWSDAVILAAHLTGIGCDIETVAEPFRDEEYRRLAAGLENLLTFMVDETGTELAGGMESIVNVSRRAVLIRRGTPEQDGWMARQANAA